MAASWNQQGWQQQPWKNQSGKGYGKQSGGGFGGMNILAQLWKVKEEKDDLVKERDSKNLADQIKTQVMGCFNTFHGTPTVAQQALVPAQPAQNLLTAVQNAAQISAQTAQQTAANAAQALGVLQTPGVTTTGHIVNPLQAGIGLNMILQPSAPAAPLQQQQQLLQQQMQQQMTQTQQQNPAEHFAGLKKFWKNL